MIGSSNSNSATRVKSLAAAMFAAVLAIVGLRAGAQTLNDGLAVYLPFNGDMENKSTSDVAVQDAPEASPTCAAITANGFFGKYLNITTNSTEYGYVKLPGTDTGSLSYPNNKTFSAILWVRLGVTQNVDPVVFGNNGWGGKEKGFIMASASGSKKQVNIHAADGSNRFDKYFDWEASDIWTFYAVVCDNGSFRMYQGKSAVTNTLSRQTASLPNFTLATGYPFYLGQGGTGTYGRHFIGAIDDFALWTRALSEEDIQRIYECGRSGMELGDLLKMDTNDAPTMEVSASDNDSATLSFGGRRENAHTLFVAYGAADAGKNKHAWTGFMPIAEIAADATEYTYTFPDLFKAESTRYRFFLMQTNNLPYVKEVTYAHSDGTAYIDSGVAPRRYLITEFDARLTAQNGKYDNFFGSFCVNGNKLSNYGICRYYNSANASDAYNNKWDREFNTGKGYQMTGSCVLDVDYHVVFSTTNLFVNGEEQFSGITAAQFLEGGYGINLYRNIKAGSQYDQTIIGYFNSFSLYTPERTARDFSPVVDSDGTTAMFDAVTGEMYRSAGSALTAGADCDAARIGWVRAVSDAGLVVGDTAPATALYVGAGADPGNLSDPANWTCWNSFGGVIESAVPTEVTAVTVRGETAFTVSSGSMPAYRSITFDNVVLANGATWRGLDFAIVTSDSVVDLHGRTLLLEGPSGEVVTPFTITDTSADSEHPGELHIEVAAGANFVNSAIAIGGNLKFVKEGDGIYTAAMSGQSYTGGTDVAAGTLRPGAAATGHFGTGTLMVAGDGTFDLCGMDMSAYTILLAGGTITSSAGDGTLPLHLTLSADSKIAFANVAGTHDIKATGSEWNLGGFALTLRLDGNDPDFYIASKTGTTSATTTISNGTLKVEVPATAVNGSGAAYYAWVHIANLNGRDGLSLDLGKSSLRMEPASGNSSVFDFTAMPAQGDVKSTKTMEIYGTYLPASRYGFNMTMMDGSTIDLSGQTGSWNSKFANTKDYSDKNPKVSFAENATVKVNLEGRSDLKELAESDAPYVITWPEAPSGTVKFVLDEATADARYRVRAEAEGLKISRASGTVITVR